MALEKLIQKAKKTILPILSKEDIDDHIDRILAENDHVRLAVDKNPQLYGVLRQYVERTVDRYKLELYGSKTVDTIDQVASLVELGAGAVGGPLGEGLASVGSESIEAVTKIPYAAYYAVDTGDYMSIPYFALMEAASLIPYVGEAIDMSTIYVDRLRKQIRKKSVEDFLENAGTN